jgi:hypothetical protein
MLRDLIAGIVIGLVLGGVAGIVAGVLIPVTFDRIICVSVGLIAGALGPAFLREVFTEK